MEDADPGLLGVALQLVEQTPPHPQAAYLRSNPHAFELARRIHVELEGATADRIASQTGDHEEASGRSELVRECSDAAGRIPPSVEAFVELGNVLLQAP